MLWLPAGGRRGVCNDDANDRDGKTVAMTKAERILSGADCTGGGTKGVGGSRGLPDSTRDMYRKKQKVGGGGGTVAIASDGINSIFFTKKS